MDMEVENGTEPRRRSGGDAAGSLGTLLSELGSTLVDYGKLQLQLLGDDVQQEIRSAAQALTLGAFVAVLFGVGLLMAALSVVIGFWDSPYRLLAAILATVGLFIIAGVGVVIVRKKMRRRASPLSGAIEAGLLLAAYKRLIR